MSGRPLEPTDTKTDALLAIWFKRFKKKDKDAEGRLLDPLLYLTLASELEMPLRSIWLLTERWIEMDRLASQKKLAKARAT